MTSALKITGVFWSTLLESYLTQGAQCFLQKKKEMKAPKKRPRCAHPGCVRIPSFNLPDQAFPLFCRVHTTSRGMVNVIGPRCAYEGGCYKAPSCNFPNEKVRLMCKVHALPGMLNIMSARCAHPGCSRIGPTYNLPTETRGVLCKDHAGPEMIDVLNKKCAHTGCGTRPSYNIPGLRSGLFCLEHKSATATMVNVLNKFMLPKRRFLRPKN
jgi:hypothetical protein